MPVRNPLAAKKRKVDSDTVTASAPRQSSRSRQPSIRALQHLFDSEEAETDDEMDLLGSDADEDDIQVDELEDDEELMMEGSNCSGDDSETAVDSGGEEPAPVVPSKRTRGPGKGAYLLLLMVPPY